MKSFFVMTQNNLSFGNINGITEYRKHRVDTVSPVVRIGTPPPPHTQASVSPLWFRGGGRGMGGGSQFQ
jgi:hypothetical protein